MASKSKAKHIVTDETKNTVTLLTAFGIRQEQIAIYLNISDRTLRKHYRRELDTGLITANMKVASSLFKNAIDNESVAAQIFWLKTRAGWKETVEEDKDKEVAPLNINFEVRQAENEVKITKADA